MICNRMVSFAVVLAVALGASAVANAQVRDWSLVRAQGFDQTANNVQPTTPVVFEYFGQVATDTPNDFTANGVSLEGSPAGTFLFTAVDFGGGLTDWEFRTEVPTLAALNAALPNGTYSIEATGPLGTFSESISIAGDFPVTPYFTGNTFNNLQNANAADAIAISWNTPPVDGWFLAIEQLSTGDEVYFQDQFMTSDSLLTSIVLPSGTLNPGTAYGIYIDFPVATADVRDGFQTGGGVSGQVSSTQIQFSTRAIPEPSSLVLFLGGVAASLLGSLRGRSKH